MKKIIKNVLRKVGIEITRYTPEIHREEFIALKTKKEYKGNVLLSYDINPFLLKDGESLDNSHISEWQCFQIAETFLELGYDVDVINYHDKKFAPNKTYSFFIDVLSNMERISPLLNKDCIKIFHPLFAHWLFHNTVAYKRHLALQQRKGIVLKPPRLLPPNMSVEYADYIIVLGNQFTISTNSYAQKPIYRVPNAPVAVYHWPVDKDFQNCQNTFLWLGGNGLVYKGLDLVLEAFAEMPDFDLYVCGPIQTERDFGTTYKEGLYQTPKEEEFESAYYKELYQTSNIHTMGWVNVSSPEFVELTGKCIGLIYPSSSEGQSGSVVNCLHAGLIPIISYESGVDVNDFGVILRDCSIGEIKKAIKEIANLPHEELEKRAHKAWEFARANYTRERFSEAFKNALLRIINSKGEDKKND